MRWILAVCLFLLASSACATTCNAFQPFITISQESFFTYAGPRSITGGNVEGIVDKPVLGEVYRILTHPTDPNITYVGLRDGGIFKTESALLTPTNWTQIGWNLEQWTVTSLSFDNSDKEFKSIVASLGSSSDQYFKSTIAYTKDNGETWNNVGDSFSKHNLKSALKHDKTIVACSAGIPGSDDAQRGIFLSKDEGKTFTRLTTCKCNDMVRGTKSFFIVTLDKGVFELSDTDTLTSITPENIVRKFKESANARISLGQYDGEDYLYVGFLKTQVIGLYRVQHESTWKWVEIEEPKSDNEGLNPAMQGALYFSILPHKDDKNLVYLSGDEQINTGEWPNSINASAYVGRLFEVDIKGASRHITHSNTADTSAPGKNSNHLAMNAQGDLLDADSSGLYKRTKPKDNSGKWTSLNGNIYSANSFQSHHLGSGYYIMSSATSGLSFGPKNSTWTTLSTDAGSTLQGLSSKNNSVVYFSPSGSNYIECLTFMLFNKTVELESITRPALRVGTGSLPDEIFRTRVQLVVNRFNANRIIIPYLFSESFESINAGDDFSELVIAESSSGILSAVYGGIIEGKKNENFLILLSAGTMAIRKDTSLRVVETFPPLGVTGEARAVAVHPDNANHIVALFSSGDLVESKDGGLTWKLHKYIYNDEGCMILNSIVIVPDADGKTNVLASGVRGVFIYREDKDLWYQFAKWSNSKITNLKFDIESNTLWADASGNGIWEITNASSTILQSHFSLLPAPPPNPNYQLLTWIFAALATVLILVCLILIVAFIRSKQNDYEIVN